jgi:L-alanine-DL-glutamate epimerase-like enolase superfamily enzyme
MKITDVEAIVLHAQDSTLPDELDVGGYAGYQVVVRVKTDEGIEGWGECCTGGEYGEAAEAVRILIQRGFKPRILGKDPRDYRNIWEKLYQDTVWFGRRGLTVFAMSGIDTALVDIAAKARGVPACVLLGGRNKDRIPIYASLLFDMDYPEATGKKGLEYLKAGYYGVKFGWGMVPSRSFGANPEADEQMLQSIRQVIGEDARLMIDVGRWVHWDADYAIRMANRFEKYNLFWLEEALPQDDVDGYVKLAASVETTIAAGECLYTLYDFTDVIKRHALDLIQPDVSKGGGLSESKRIIDFADANSVRWVPHNWSTAINTAASLQLAASSPKGFLLEFKQEPNPLVTELSKHPFSIENGALNVPDTPGLGIDINLDAIEKYRVQPSP